MLKMKKSIFFIVCFSLQYHIGEITGKLLRNKNGILQTNLNPNEENKMILQQVLQDIVTPLRSRLKCVGIFCDPYYQDIFGHSFFTKHHFPPYFKMLFKENEDLLSPNFHSLKVVRKVQYDGCQVYIIFISNGLQLSRFLRFGDRYRVLNTRAKFILLHDARLFAPDLHYLWKKFVNVIFLRSVEGFKINQPGKIHSTAPWIEISTVPFPSPIRGILVPQRLDTWRNGKFHSGVDLFRDKTSNLQNQSLQVITFQNIPSAVQENKSTSGIESTQFVGLEVEVLKTFAAKMNFRAKIYEQNRTEKWGHKQLNGSFTGLLGEIVSGRAEIALGNLYYTPYFLNLMDLSIPYITECLTFLTPEILTDNSWRTLILPLKPLMWAAVIVTLLLGGFIFYSLTHFQKHLNEGMPDDKSPDDVLQDEGFFVFGTICNAILYSFGMLLLVSLPKLPPGWSLRLLTGWWWIYCVLVVVAYRASMTAILANPAPRVTIDTLDQLADSHISCGGWGEQEKEFFLTSLDDAGKKIGQKFEIVLNEEEAITKVATGEFAYYGNIFFLRHARIMRQVTTSANNSIGQIKVANAPGEKSLHIMHDCVINMPISIGLQKNSPLKTQIDKFLYRIIEAGLVKKWLYNVMLTTNALENIIKDSSSTSALMDLRKMYGALVALGIGYFFSSIVLIGEVLHWNYIVKRSPYYDKYAINLYYSRMKNAKNKM